MWSKTEWEKDIRIYLMKSYIFYQDSKNEQENDSSQIYNLNTSDEPFATEKKIWLLFKTMTMKRTDQNSQTQKQQIKL